nr:classical arabinogalactan protein 9-like [Aegilops tauschii subsp. strangulata]
MDPTRTSDHTPAPTPPRHRCTPHTAATKRPLPAKTLPGKASQRRRRHGCARTAAIARAGAPPTPSILLRSTQGSRDNRRTPCREYPKDAGQRRRRTRSVLRAPPASTTDPPLANHRRERVAAEPREHHATPNRGHSPEPRRPDPAKVNPRSRVAPAVEAAPPAAGGPPPPAPSRDATVPPLRHAAKAPAARSEPSLEEVGELRRGDAPPPPTLPGLCPAADHDGGEGGRRRRGRWRRGG